MITKKHYEGLAEVIGSASFILYEKMPASTALLYSRIADYLEADNPRFDRERFIKAIAQWREMK